MTTYKKSARWRRALQIANLILACEASIAGAASNENAPLPTEPVPEFLRKGIAADLKRPIEELINRRPLYEGQRGPIKVDARFSEDGYCVIVNVDDEELASHFDDLNVEDLRKWVGNLVYDRLLSYRTKGARFRFVGKSHEELYPESYAIARAYRIKNPGQDCL